jgi:hypothetical protein
MSRPHPNSSLFQFYFYFVTVSHLSLTAADSGFHSETCYNDITELLQSNTTLDPSLFVDISDPSNLTLTYKGCLQICGSGTGWYSDIGPRLVDWFLPIFLLVFNMQFASIGMERFWMIMHLLGDPIDSTWSLLAKADSWSRCFSDAQRLLGDSIDVKSLAITMAATEEVLPSLVQALQSISADNSHLIRQTGSTLVENRRSEIIRTFFAVAMYVFQVLAAFIPAIGAASSPSGGRIGTAMLLSWLFSVVLLSNAVGDLGSTRNCQRTILDLMERLELPHDVYTESSLPWSGAIYSYRPQKRLHSASEWKLALISVLPVAIAFGTAFAVLDTGPTYFTCRHILVITAFSFWLVSALLTSLLSRIPFASGKYLWIIILIKDAFIGVPILVLVVLSSCGLWNTCYCWGGVLVHGEEGARISPNPTAVFSYNDKVVYPPMVVVCLFFQACVFGVMLWAGWPGLRAMMWTEKEKLAASGMTRYPQVSSGAAQSDIANPESASVALQVKEDKPDSTDQILNSVLISVIPVSPEEPAAATDVEP